MAFIRRSGQRLATRKLGLESLENRHLLTGGLSDPNLVVMPSAIPLPAVGVPFVDATFGTTLRRVSDASERGGFETHIYSQLQAFSSDNAYLLLTGSSGYVVRRVSDLSLVTGLNTANWNVPRWHPTQPHVLVHFDTNADTDVTVQFTNVDAGITTDVYTLPSQYQYIRGNQSFDELSDDGRWLAGMVTRNDGQSVLFSLDIQNRRLGAVLPLHEIYTTHAQPDPVWGEVEPDWVGVSPLGGYLVVAWQRDGTAGASGVETFNIHTGAFTGRVNDGHQHGDLGVMPDGVSEYYMTFEIYGSPADRNRPAIGLRRLPGNSIVSQPSFLQSLDWGNGEHISARGPNGVGLITSGVDTANGWTNFEGEVWLQRTDNSVLRLAHHRSSSSDYWVQPRATVSRDGRYVVFASDWGRQTGGFGDPYIIDLGATDPPPPAGDSPPSLDPLANQTVSEGQTLAFTATASDPDGNALRFSLDAGAPAGATIDPVSGRFTWSPSDAQGPATYIITVRVTDDGLPNQTDAETFTVNVLETPRLSIGDMTVIEGDSGTLLTQFVVTLSAASTQVVTVQYATAAASAAAGSDFQATSGLLTFNPGETRRTVSVLVIGDRLAEPNETFFVNLASADNATIADGQGRGTIVDNDLQPALSINNVSLQEGNSGTKAATFTVRLSHASPQPVTVAYATSNGTARSGRDYVAASGTLTFAPGQVSQQVIVLVYGDTRDEFDETFFVVLSNSSGASVNTDKGQATIVDNDPAPTLRINDVRLFEGNIGTRYARFTVTLSAASDKPISVNFATVNGTANASDYHLASGTLSFAAGETVKTISVAIKGDARKEGNESFFLNLTGALNAGISDGQGLGTILNDDQR